MGSNGQNKSVYIFKKDYEAMVEFVRDDPHQQASGNLFGLWTTDGEAVIHIISEHSLCTERDRNLADISRKLDCPLSHIGNWRYYDSLELLQQDSRQMELEYTSCRHQTRGKFLRFGIVKSKSTQELMLLPHLYIYRKQSPPTMDTVKLQFLKDESPFENVKGIREIALDNSRFVKCFDTDRTEDHEEQMDWSPSCVIEDSPSYPPKDQSHTLALSYPWSREHVQTEALPSIDTKQSRALCGTGNRGFQSDFSSKRDFKVFMFKEDYQMMQRLVLEYPNLETGGDLFGLWTTEGDAVLHAVLGPGKNCKRSGASFYQDIPYLKRNGELLTQDYMLCHIGEWHSHHQLHLFQPSGGDSSTVIRNYPRGTRGFILIIANIVSSNEVKLRPYLYTETSRHGFHREGTIVPLPNKNAFNGIGKIGQSKEMGREEKTHSQHTNSLSRYSYNRFQQSPPSPRQVRARVARSPTVPKRNSGMLYRTSQRPALPGRP